MFNLHKEESLVDVTTLKEEAAEKPISPDEQDPHKLA